MPQDRADLERPPRPPPDERPETARPPLDPEPALDEPVDSDVLDIDALLPVAMASGAARVAIGQDLADILRSAEERLDVRGESSQPGSSYEGAADVPVPDDVLEILGEPLEADEEDGLPPAAGSSAGTGADRPATLDGPLATAHGEEDLEQPLPRASDMPRKMSARPPEPRASVTSQVSRSSLPAPASDPGKGVTTSGRSDSSRPGLTPPRGAVTGHGVTAELHVLPLGRAADDIARRDLDAPDSDEEPAVAAAPPRRAPAEFVDRPTPFERPMPGERGAALVERNAGIERGAVIDRGAALIERNAAFERAGAPDRTAAFERIGAGDRTAAFERPGAGDRTAAFERPGAGDRTAAFERPAVTDRAAFPERLAVTDRGAAERPQTRTVERTPHADAARWHTAKMISPVAAEAMEASPRSRASRTEAMPAVLGPGDAPRALGRAIANRLSGALLVTSGDEQRRILLHDGDLVTAGSGMPTESLVAFLAARGDIDRDLVPRLAGKLPAFGRHAGAALVANGYLGQDDLWPVLRAHGEWVMGRALLVESGTCEVEPDPPARYKAEPSVFGGATGAEVFVDAVQRVISPESALARLGGFGARLVQGSRAALLGECALSPDDQDAMRAAAGQTVHQFTGDGPTDRWSLLYALVCLDVLDALPAVSAPKQRAESATDPLDEEAIRARVRARSALVEEGDYFALLGVPRTATAYEIRRAYLDLRRTFEPARILTAQTADLADDVRLVVEVIEEAYEILRDAHRRERYRRAIEAGPPR